MLPSFTSRIERFERDQGCWHFQGHGLHPDDCTAEAEALFRLVHIPSERQRLLEALENMVMGDCPSF